MYHRACVAGVVLRLQKLLGDEAGTYVGYRPTLRPAAVSGQWFVSVGQSSFAGNGYAQPNGIDIRHTVSVCVTVKYGHVPPDRLGGAQMGSFDQPNPGPAIAANGRAQVLDDFRIQPPLDWLVETVIDGLVEDFTALACMDFYLGAGAGEGGAPVGTRPGGDDYNRFVEPFHTFSAGVVQEVSADWVGGQPGALPDGAVLCRIVTFSGARSLTAARYPRGLDRDIASVP